MNDIGGVWFCARECERQRTSPIYVAYMYDALVLAREWYSEGKRLDDARVQQLNATIVGGTAAEEYGWCRSHYRETPVSFPNGTVAINHQLVPRAMDNFFSALCLDEPDDLVREFLVIHPFVDGNGRTAAIIYNWLNDSLFNPVDKPEYVFS